MIPKNRTSLLAKCGHVEEREGCDSLVEASPLATDWLAESTSTGLVLSCLALYARHSHHASRVESVICLEK
jgi:hypothetical protein